MKIRCVDPHVHCRDEEQANKATIRSVSELARRQGIQAIFDMPNCKRPITSRKRVNERIALAEKEKPVVDYYLYVGLTADRDQIAEAVEIVKTEPKVCGLKAYFGPSVGNLGVTETRDQRNIYQTLARRGYIVLAGHCEKESLFKPKLWNPKEPWTHCLARPPQAEIESVRDQIKFALETDFKGNLHICHVSCPESVDLIHQVRRRLRITCGVTPHHILFTSERLKEKDGLLYKVNPPLRNPKRVKKLRQYLKQGKIDWIETDHAPHTLKDKLEHPYCSGIPSLKMYKRLLFWLNREGLSWKEIEKLTYWNIVNTFRLNKAKNRS